MAQIYLSQFIFPGREREYEFIFGQKRTCYDTYYPFQVLRTEEPLRLDFEPITILCGGNGSGKTTALNVMAETLRMERDALYNRSNFFEDFTEMCQYRLEDEPSGEKRVITSDDVFDYMLDIRSLNEGIHRQKERALAEYAAVKNSKFQMKSLDDYEQLKKVTRARRSTGSAYVRGETPDTVREQSNGESAFFYFTQKIKEEGLYLLDEPENSLSPERQLQLKTYLEDSVRFFGCQFIIATHSPFLLSLRGAKIYDLDKNPVRVCPWTALPHVRAYYEFFKEHEKEFT